MRLLTLAVVFCLFPGAAARAEWAGRGPAPIGWPGGRVHPAVVRVITPQRDGMALGSGTLVAVNDAQGLVVTNWHVVEEAAGPISVLFPDGFSSTATVLRTDRDWDLAALLIRRPNVQPVRLATRPPRRGDLLMIAGYGSGTYRAAAGRCTQYVAPGPNRPYEMVELATSARQGDSGGPIFNHEGELAGVLFGTGGGSTTGSYCGRVRRFLAPVLGDLPPASPPSTIAQRPRNAEPSASWNDRQASPPPPAPPAAAVARPVAAVRAPAAAPAGSPAKPEPVAVPATAAAPPRAPETAGGTDVAPASGPIAGKIPAPADRDAPGTVGLAEQLKTILAVVGLVAILFHGLRLLSLAQGS